VDFARADGSIAECFLRFDPSDPELTKDPWTLQREATVYVALQGTPVPVPRVLGVHPVRQAMLSERVEGETWFSRIADPAEAESTARAFMAALAALHSLNPAALDLGSLAPVESVRQAAVAQIDEMQDVLDRRGGPVDPALVFTLGWLRRHVPTHDGPVVLVQGDTGPGNFMYAGGQVTAVVDWELAHLGDPMDDIAWLTLRATQEPFTDLAARLREYEELTGNIVDEGRVTYYRVLAEAKIQVMGHRGGRTDGSPAEGDDHGSDHAGRDAGNAFIYAVLHRRLWLEALAAATGAVFEPVPPLVRRAPRGSHWMYDAVLAQLREVIVPRTSDPLAAARAKGVARLVKYLAQVDMYGDDAEAQEVADLSELLGQPVADLAQGRERAAEAVERGEVTDADYVRALWRRVARETELARPAMGVLADRHWPDLR